MPYNIEIFISDYGAILTCLKVSNDGVFKRRIYSIFPPSSRNLDTGFFLVSLCLYANSGMVPKIPSCHYMLLI